MEYATKTEIYKKIKKPVLERQRRARINKCVGGLKQLMVNLNDNSKILRLDQAEVLETTIIFLKQRGRRQQISSGLQMNSFRNGYMNAVNEVSRILASTPDMTVEMGRSVMTHLGRSYNRLQQQYEHSEQQKHTTQHIQEQQQQLQPLTNDCPLSPASSGYQSDDNDSPTHSPTTRSAQLWRPW